MIGRRTLYLCDGRCGLAQCEALARYAIQALGVTFGETTRDGRFRLAMLRCREHPACAPIVMIDDDIYVVEHPSELEVLLEEALVGP